MIGGIAESICGFSFSDIRKALPEDVDSDYCTSLFERIIEQRLSSAVGFKQAPFLINVSGIPCSGKSIYCKKLKTGFDAGEEPEVSGAVWVSFDDIMEDAMSPYYSEKYTLGAGEAYDRWELPARIAGYELLRRAALKKCNILFEHSSALQAHTRLFSHLMGNGYKVHFRHIDISPQEAVRYLWERTYRSQGKIEEYIFERYDSLLPLLPEYEKICTTYKNIEQWQLE